ncbi:MAG: four-helix bundle copper-binding protein [Euryarchaeota archaeon]|nr:four-helix bundle copper-binding protein [Euryarchaeota archaeon]
MYILFTCIEINRMCNRCVDICQ